MSVGAVPMSQWPSDHEYTIPVPGGPATPGTVDMVTLTIDGKQVHAPRGELLIKVAQEHGTYIPRFCYHERMKPVGMCRMCLVEVEGMRGLQISCATPVNQDMVVTTQSPMVKQAQDGVLEFLLINHPLDCPVCDRGGECPLQDQTLSFGPGESRYVEEKRHFEKPIPISDLVLLDRERCIQCGRCTRFAAEVAGDPLIDFGGRGEETEVITYPDEPFSSYFSGNVVQICPVGALTASPYRFKARPWDLEAVETSCQACSVGCRGALESTTNRLVRLLGVDSEPVNQGWLCDKGRYGYEWVHSDARVASPAIRASLTAQGGSSEESRGSPEELVEVSWPEALDAAAGILGRTKGNHGPEAIGVLGGAEMTNEDVYCWTRLAKGVLGTDNADAQLGDGLPADLVLGMPRATIADIDRAKAIVVVGVDTKDEIPVVYLRLRAAAVDRGIPLVEIGARDTGLTRYATTVLRHAPGASADVVAKVASALGGRKTRTKAIDELSDLVAGRAGPIVVVLGRPSVAESVDDVVHAASLLAGVNRGVTGRGLHAGVVDTDVRFLSALGRANVHGALDLGFTPGFLPGRVSLDAGRDHVAQTWGGAPAATGLDAAGILRGAADGSIKTLVLLGADPLVSFPDRALARDALAKVEHVVCVGAFAGDGIEHADVALPPTVWGEQRGSTTNLEGRVMRLGRIVTPDGATMEPWRIACELAVRLGADFDLESTDEVQDEIAKVAPAFAGVDAALIRRARDGVVLPYAERPDEVHFGPGAPAAGVSWEPIPAAPEEITTPEASSSKPRVVEPPVALPTWGAGAPAPAAAPIDAYSLRLVAARTLYGADRIVMASPSLARITDDVARLVVNSRDLATLGVEEGTAVRATSSRGTVDLPVAVDDSVPRGTAFIASNRSGPGAADLIDVGEPVTDLRIQVIP
jgi:NADH-quinone oxidoreductase subunit G